MKQTVRVLGFHAGYRCRHAGACCTSNWPIPVEADRLATMQAALASGRLRPGTGAADAAIEWASGAPADTPAMLARHHERCVFFASSGEAGDGRCLVHRALGHDALPLACRQFPRVSVRDPRGASVTLSHYCPTAAALLDSDRPDTESIIVDAPAFPASGEYVGLDARHSLPPLLRPDMLMDWEAWWECEQLAVDTFGSTETSAVALARVRAAVSDIQVWSPGDGRLIDRVRTAFARAARGRAATVPIDPSRLIDAVFDAIPPDLQPARATSSAPTSDDVLGRFLAAHAFANWAVHLGNGLETWLRSIEAAAALIGAGAGIRQADLLLRHLVDPGTLAKNLSA